MRAGLEWENKKRKVVKVGGSLQGRRVCTVLTNRQIGTDRQAG